MFVSCTQRPPSEGGMSWKAKDSSSGWGVGTVWVEQDQGMGAHLLSKRVCLDKLIIITLFYPGHKKKVIDLTNKTQLIKIIGSF